MYRFIFINLNKMKEKKMLWIQLEQIATAYISCWFFFFTLVICNASRVQATNNFSEKKNPQHEQSHSDSDKKIVFASARTRQIVWIWISAIRLYVKQLTKVAANEQTKEEKKKTYRGRSKIKSVLQFDRSK